MSGFVAVLTMSALLGFASFGVGMLPLSFTFSRSHIKLLSTYGTGLLLGAALGVIIPEGIETLISESPSKEVPTTKIAFSLLLGFAFMLIVEQLIHSHNHSPPSQPTIVLHGPSHPGITTEEDEDDIDAQLAELEGRGGLHHRSSSESVLELGGVLKREEQDAKSRQKAFPLTLGLVIHSLADGLALGASALPRGEGSGTSSLSLVVFFALAIHKAPTSLALTTSLLGTSLPRPDCKKHIAFFSAATPVGALLAFLMLSFLGAGVNGDWTGVSLLLSGGTFLYVAAVLQPVSHGNDSAPREMSEVARVAIIVLGMFTPLAIGLVMGHEHEHSHAGDDAVL